MNFRLNSLHLGTDFDQEIEPLTVPGVAGRGQISALCILDGAKRAPHRLVRLARRVCLLGIKIANPGEGVRVTMTLMVDDISTIMWNKVHSKGDEEPLLENEFRRHRLVEVSAQGRTRALAMLALRRPDEQGARHQIRFDLQGSEIGDSGLLMFGLEEPANIPSWAERGLLEDGLVGLCVVKVKIQPIPQDGVPAWVSSGRPRRRERLVSPARLGFFVVNPGEGGEPVQVTLTPRALMEQKRLLGRRAKLKAPVLALRQWARTKRPRKDVDLPVEVEVVSISGEAIFKSRIDPRDDGRYSFTLPASQEAAFARARTVHEGDREPRSSEWLVRVS